MLLAIFKGTYLLGELTLHERASETEKMCQLLLKCQIMHLFN